MAGIIKNQILKHLSRFVKNLSSDKISLSTLKGEGELSNLELEEEVLTELLALPTWMKLTHAKCNKAKIRIQWTKLKSVPILLSLDEVIIRVEACEELRTTTSATSLTGASAGKYGFVNKVIDGITATVNSVEITFHSKAFESKVEISRIKVESQSPNWKKAELQGTRLKCLQRGETLVFKAMEWQTLRLEARSTSDRTLAPLRLLTNQAKARIVIKKKLSDCQVLGCRLSLILDDLLWVLTDSQILAALHFMSSLSGLIKQATELTQRFKAARKLESLPEYQAQLSQTTPVNRVVPNEASRIFDHFDVKETSYHLLCEKIDLHFCDDPGTGRSKHEDLKDGGALQLLLLQTMVDVYPYHLASGDRRGWPKYTDNALSQWLTQSLSSFRIALIDAISSDSMHTPLTRTQNYDGSSSTGDSGNPIRKAVTEQLGKLMSTCLILKVQDLRLYKVTTSSKRDAPQPFLSTYIDRPKELQTIHAEFTFFYYPSTHSEVCFPLPSPKIYAHMYPFQVHLDMCTIIWISAFISNLQNAMSLASLGDSSEPDYVDVRIELIMPKVVFENKHSYPSQKERPQSIHFQASRVVLSNYRSSDTGSLCQLAQCLELLQRGDLAYGVDFPAKEKDVPLIAEKFISHTEGRDKIRKTTKTNCSSFQECASFLTKDMMNTEPRDVWYIFLDPFWADFEVSSAKKKRNPSTTSKHRSLRDETHDSSSSTLYPFIDSVPMSAWIYSSEEENLKDVPNKKKNIRALFNVDGICNVQLTHFQYLVLLRAVEAFSEISLYLTHDLEQIIGQRVYDNLVTLIGYLPKVELSLLFPPLLPGKQESSPSMDLDSSAIPESSSGENDDNQQENGNIWKLREQEPEQKSFTFTSDNLGILTAATTTTIFSTCSSPVNNNSASMTDSIRTSVNQVKHGVSNLAVTFNKVGGISTPDSEVASQWSNLSSEEENNFITLDDEFGAGAIVDGTVEVATEAILDDTRSTPSPSFSVGSHAARAVENDNLVGVLTVLLDNVEVAQEIKGLSSILKVQCRSLSLMECPGMPWQEFQTKFAARNRSWVNTGTNNLGSPTQKRVIKLRLSQMVHIDRFENSMRSEDAQRSIANLRLSGPRINLTDRPGGESPIRQAIIDATDAILEAKIDLQGEDLLTLHMSTIVGLTDFVEDEIYPSPFPMEIEVIGATIELLEDRPSMNITSPGPVPVKLAIPNLLPISRDNDGVFQIGYKNNLIPTMHSTNVEQSNGRTKLDIILADFEKIQQQLQSVQRRNSELEKELQDSQHLKVMILKLQEQVNKLQDEKSVLLNRLRS